MAAVVLLWSYSEMSGLSPVNVLEGKQLHWVSSRPSRELTQQSSARRSGRRACKQRTASR